MQVRAKQCTAFRGSEGKAGVGGKKKRWGYFLLPSEINSNSQSRGNAVLVRPRNYTHTALDINSVLDGILHPTYPPSITILRDGIWPSTWGTATRCLSSASRHGEWRGRRMRRGVSLGLRNWPQAGSVAVQLTGAHQPRIPGRSSILPGDPNPD
ncbi:hypothetical protein VTI74DRAFT_7355 [Chaetomium olivicolor]